MRLPKRLLAEICFVLLLAISAVEMQAQKLPPKKETLDAMRRANAYFMQKWPDAGKSIITNKERPSNIWTRAVYYEGLMALNAIDAQKEYTDYALQWG